MRTKIPKRFKSVQMLMWSINKREYINDCIQHASIKMVVKRVYKGFQTISYWYQQVSRCSIKYLNNTKKYPTASTSIQYSVKYLDNINLYLDVSKRFQMIHRVSRFFKMYLLFSTIVWSIVKVSNAFNKNVDDRTKYLDAFIDKSIMADRNYFLNSIIITVYIININNPTLWTYRI